MEKHAVSRETLCSSSSWKENRKPGAAQEDLMFLPLARNMFLCDPLYHFSMTLCGQYEDQYRDTHIGILIREGKLMKVKV